MNTIKKMLNNLPIKISHKISNKISINHKINMSKSNYQSNKKYRKNLSGIMNKMHLT